MKGESLEPLKTSKYFLQIKKVNVQMTFF